MFTYSTTDTKDRLEVSLVGDLDIDGTEVMEEQLLPLLQEYKQILINFEEVPFVDSSGIGLLMNLVKVLKEKNIEVTIVNVRQDVTEVFELLQLQDILGKEVFL